MAEEEWAVESEASDEERGSSLGSEGLGGPPKRKHVWTEPGDLELAELYKRVAQDGYIELQCVQERTTKSQNSRESEPAVNVDPNIRQQENEKQENEKQENEKQENEKQEAKLDGPVGHDSTFDFCEDVDVIPATPQTAQKRSDLKGAKKRKARSVSRWNNVIRHLQMDYEADFEKLECETCAVAKVKEKDVVHPCKEEAFLQPSGGQSGVAAGGFDMSFSLSSIDSSMTKDGLQDKIKHAQTLLASQQAD